MSNNTLRPSVMKYNPSLLSLIFMILFSCLTAAQVQEKFETDMFKRTERDSLQLWFYDRATVMGLNPEKRDEFYNIVLYHTFKMKALEKKEKGYTKEEVRTKFQALLTKQNNEVKALLNEKQYTYYLDTFNKILKEVYERKGWE